jgi:HEAT repeat protein
MIKKSLAVSLALIVVAGIGLLYARAQRAEMQRLLNQLRSEEINERGAAAQALIERRTEVVNSPDVISSIENLVRESASQENRKGTAKTAIMLLGDLQSVRSVPFLVEYLSFGVFYKDTKRTETPEDAFPAVRALIKIGDPAIEPVLRKAEATDDPTVLQNAALVIKGVLKNEAIGFMESRRSHELEPRVRQRQQTMEETIVRWNKIESRSPVP